MAIPFKQIQSDFNQLRSVLTKDLQEIENQGASGGYGAYAATLVIACACEILGNLRYTGQQRAERFFADQLASQLPKSIADEVYAALRNGLVHLYGTKLIKVDRQQVDIVISWGAVQHLVYDKVKNRIPVDVMKLSSDLQKALNRFETHLRGDATARDHFFTEWDKARVHTVQGPQQREEWLKFLTQS